MKVSSNIKIDNYVYDLPAEKIAYQPAGNRDQSRLLVYKQQQVNQDRFSNIVDQLPQNGLLIFNNTRVVQARLIFYKPTGARIEVFCLEPADNDQSLHDAYNNPSPVIWKCLIGNAKKWKDGILEKFDAGSDFKLQAEKIKACDDHFLVKFSWKPLSKSFAQMLEVFGRIPLPPYINREDNQDDKIRYQTLYGNLAGSVAAPTAGLHFSEEIINELTARNIPTLQVTLHVGAGTFKPVTTSKVDEHKMHNEQFSVSKPTLEKLVTEHERPYINVGTTTVRTLESIYWFGVRLVKNNYDIEDPIKITQWEPYQYDLSSLPSRKEVLKKLIEWMGKNNIEDITGTTSLMIIPGYRYKMTDVMITNFHQPASTLLLLVAAFVGDDWRKIYDYALNNDFRFLSYGDGCLLFPKHSSSPLLP